MLNDITGILPVINAGRAERFKERAVAVPIDSVQHDVRFCLFDLRNNLVKVLAAEPSVPFANGRRSKTCQTQLDNLNWLSEEKCSPSRQGTFACRTFCDTTQRPE